MDQEQQKIHDTNTSQTADNKLKNKPWIGPLILIVTLITLLLGLELIAFLWEKKTAQAPLGWTLVASRRLSYEKKGSDEFPYLILEPGQNYNYKGIPVNINKLGLRGPEIDIEKKPDTFRILNIGDSIAFGWEVAFQDTYGVQLEKLLGDQGMTVEVITAAAPGWNLETEHNYLIEEGLSFQPDLVILDLTVVNDIGGTGPVFSENLSLTDWLRDNTYFWPFLTIQARYLFSKVRGPEAIPVLNPPSEAEAYYPTDVNDPVYNSICTSIHKMAIASQEHEIPFILIVFPTALQINSANHPDTPQQALRRCSDQIGIQMVDLLPIYSNFCEVVGPDACEGFENELFADVWMHPKVNGHTMAAEALLPEVISALIP